MPAAEPTVPAAELMVCFFFLYPTALRNLCKPSYRLDTMSIVIFYTGVADAIDMAWKMDRGNCADYILPMKNS